MWLQIYRRLNSLPPVHVALHLPVPQTYSLPSSPSYIYPPSIPLQPHSPFILLSLFCIRFSSSSSHLQWWQSRKSATPSAPMAPPPFSPSALPRPPTASRRRIIPTTTSALPTANTWLTSRRSSSACVCTINSVSVYLFFHFTHFSHLSSTT